MSSKTITFDFKFWKHKRLFRKPSAAEFQKIKEKCSHYSKMGYDDFMMKGANPKHWTDYDRWQKPAELSEDVADSPVYRFKINQKIRVFAVLNEITENNVTAFILWIDPNHKSG